MARSYWPAGMIQVSAATTTIRPKRMVKAVGNFIMGLPYFDWERLTSASLPGRHVTPSYYVAPRRL